MEKFEAIHRLTDEIAPDQDRAALTAADVRRIAASGRKVALIGVENAYPIGTDLARMKEFYDRGGRYLSLAHNGHSQLADSNTGERDGKWLHNGLSALGKQAIAEMNRVGFMIDLSHPSKQSNLQAIALSKAPVIASHSSARALANHSRNMDDEELLAIKKNGGVVQTVAFDGYVKIAARLARARRGAGRGPRRRCRRVGPARCPMSSVRSSARRWPRSTRSSRRRAATVADFVDHVDYLVKQIGIDHVGISSDFDGGGGVDGWSGADETFNVTLELVRRGYTEEQIAKLWSGNLLRVMDEVQRRRGGSAENRIAVAVGLRPTGDGCRSRRREWTRRRCLSASGPTSPDHRTVLSRIPEGSTYKPDPKSRTAQDIAWQIVCEEKMLIDALEQGKAEWAPPAVPATMTEVLASVRLAERDMPRRWAALPDERWSGTMDFFGTQRPAAPMAWSFLFDIVHHRGQISTYLRPMGSTVPQIYGPSADEP